MIIQNGKQDNTTTKSIKSVCTEFAAKKIINQFELSLKSNYKIKQDPHFILQSSNGRYNIHENNSVFSCDCSFFLQNHMQCKHLFYLNAKVYSKVNKFDEAVVAPRWKKNFDASAINIIENRVFPPIHVSTIDSLEVLTNEDPANFSAFSERLRFLQNLANITGTGSVEEKNYKWSILKNINEMWSTGIMVEIKAINSTGYDDELNISTIATDDMIETGANDLIESMNTNEADVDTINIQPSTIKQNHKLCSTNHERGRPASSRVNRKRVIGTNKKRNAQLQIPIETSTISDTTMANETIPILIIGKNSKKRATPTETQSITDHEKQPQQKKCRLTIKLIDEIVSVLNHFLINSNSDNTENMIRNNRLIDEEQIKVVPDFSPNIIDSYKILKSKYDIFQFFTADGLKQLKSLLKDNF